MSATLTTTWTCDECGATAQGWSTPWDEGYAVNAHSMPIGWMKVRGRHYCDAHELLVVPLRPLRKTPAYPGQQPCNVPTPNECSGEVAKFRPEHVGRYYRFSVIRSDVAMVAGTGDGVGPWKPIQIDAATRRMFGDPLLCPEGWEPRYAPYVDPGDAP